MGKGNLFLGFGRGSVGDITYYRAYGEQVFRGRNRHPANPQTTLQLLQRVVMLTAQHAYSFMSKICDHSFQGRAVGTMSQARFTALNIAKMRQGLAGAIEEIITGAEPTWYSESNYAAKGSFLPEFMPYIISEGSIASLTKAWVDGAMQIFIEDSFTDTGTYADFCAAAGLQRGDQLTFVQLTIDDSDVTGQYNGFEFARVILEPSTEAGWTQPIFTGTGDFKTIANPNAANEGSVSFKLAESGVLQFSFGGNASEVSGAEFSPAAFAVIVSRRVGDVWQRSTESLVLRPYTVGTGNLTYDHAADFLGDAIESFKIKAGSALYLNQAENV
ncbi:unnamed protein product [Haemonchus placei]|uniref:Structural protein n=1 Tax=Haemonchus placei TaxID=6290 RepID=A0A0N4VV51_HAEPC|nr:unnamed protein product [Haemonchus placei]